MKSFNTFTSVHLYPYYVRYVLPLGIFTHMYIVTFLMLKYRVGRSGHIHFMIQCITACYKFV